MKLKDKIGETALGFFIAFLVTMIICALQPVRLVEVLFLFFISVLCTFGLSLLVYLPAFYAIGVIAMAVYRGISESRKKQNIPGDKSEKILTHVQKAALNYITTARSKGVSDNRIINTMRMNGWSEDTIQTFFPEA